MRLALCFGLIGCAIFFRFLKKKTGGVASMNFEGKSACGYQTQINALLDQTQSDKE
jgi:hypothetical protein